ncbi:MaoC family dehydratase [Candidatus Neomarinimicrobiota bacterium]
MNEELFIGKSASISKTFTIKDVKEYADLSNDKNPVHLHKEYAKSSIFGQRIVHGMLVASLFSGLLGDKLPGKGTIYLGQTLCVTAPVMIGEKVTASVEIINIRDDKPIITLQTTCVNSVGQTVINGEAIVKVS